MPSLAQEGAREWRAGGARGAVLQEVSKENGALEEGCSRLRGRKGCLRLREGACRGPGGEHGGTLRWSGGRRTRPSVGEQWEKSGGRGGGSGRSLGVEEGGSGRSLGGRGGGQWEKSGVEEEQWEKSGGREAWGGEEGQWEKSEGVEEGAVGEVWRGRGGGSGRSLGG